LAVELQAGGLTIKQIAERFGVGGPTVTSLLRDGKFYATPSSDPQRHELVKQAAYLKSKGMNPAEVGVELKLSNVKAKESWRDAGVLFAHATYSRWT
jgi:orotate phosphoribosyltransferase-like protein